jgi:tripartite-type tricarboxylate transporter receptor subunit TctC
VILARRQFLSLAARAAALPVLPQLAPAQEWPSKNIRAIVPFTAGSATDIIPRTVFNQLSIDLGQSIIVENRTGAGGTLGAAAVARAEPDGYTLLAISSAHTISPSVYPNAGYDAVQDFAGVIPLGNLPNVLVVAPAAGFKTVKDLVAAAKAKNGTITYASAGAGTATHFSAERLRLAAGFEGSHIPFRGGPEAMTEVMTGRVDFYFAPMALVLPLINDGKLQALAVSSPSRASALSDVPTTLEAGFPNSDYLFWVAVFVPAKTPPAVIARLHQQTQKTLATPSMREKLAKLGVEPMAMTSSELDALVKAEIPINAAIVKAVNIKAG